MDLNLNNKLVERPTKTVYRDNDKTIKLFVENYSKANILNEALIQARVEEATDLKIAKLLEVSQIDNRWALISEHIEGTPLDKLMEEHPEKIDEYLELFVKIQLTVHSKRVPLLNRIKDKFKGRLENATNLNDHVKYELLQRLEGINQHYKLCHGDFNPSNIIINEKGEYSIIDWSHATQGNGAADAAQTYLIFSMQGKKELAEKYLDLYCQKSDTDKTVVQRWIPIVAAVQMAKNIKEEQEFLSSWVNVVDYE